MKRFLIINPNTSAEMTASIAETVDSCITAENRADVTCAAIGPRSLESFHEYSLAAAGVVHTLQSIDLKRYDGILLACFGDPGLYGLKEYVSVPVIGIAEASLSMSLLLGDSFAVLTAGEKAVPMMKNMIRQYGLSERSAGVFALGTSVLDLESDRTAAAAAMLETGRKAVGAGADVLVLGCAGMTGFSRDLEQQLDTVTLDPVKVGIKTLETIVACGLKTARGGLYQAPPEKEIVGMEFLLGRKN